MSKPNLEIGSALSVEFDVEILNLDGTAKPVGNRQKNLLLDSGLDKIATLGITTCMQYAAVGTGTNPTYRDSGAVTVTIAGGVATASAGFFAAADVGRLLKQDSGSERYITGYTSPTVVTVGGADSAASLFTIWYVSDTGLQTESKRTGAYTNGATDNQSTFAAPGTWTHKQTFLFAAEAAPITYNEIGWSNSNAAGANLFGRALFITPPSLGIGQQLRVTLYLSVTLTPNTQTAVADVGNNGYNTSGTAMIEYCPAGSADGISSISNPLGGPNNGGTGYPQLEPFSGINHQLKILQATFAQAAAMSSTVGTAVGTVFTSSTTVVTPAYIAKTFYIDNVFNFPLSSANTASHYGITLGQTNRNFSIKFTTPQVKDAAHTLSFTIRFSWGRTLVNI